MRIKELGCGLLAGLLLGLAGGCQKSAPEPSRPLAASETLARIHWLGQERMGAETNAAGCLQLWNLPQTKALQAQTLDKLAAAPWSLSLPATTNTAALLATNAAAAQLRPLLDDLVAQEWYLEVRQAGTNAPGELALAVRLDEPRAARWQTNLAAVLESLTGRRPVPVATHAGWQLLLPASQASAPNQVQLSRAGNWTLFSLAPASADTPSLAAEFAARIHSRPAAVPFTLRATNFWLEAETDLRRVSAALGLGWHLPPDLPALSLTVIGDGEGLRARGQLNFPRPLPQLEPWNFPTNWVGEPVSFTAARGLRPLLASLPAWSALNAGGPPDQGFVWATGDFPFNTFWATPMPNASNVVSRVGAYLTEQANPWITNYSIGQFEWTSVPYGVAWKRAPFMSPFLSVLNAQGTDYLFGGLAPRGLTNQPAPADLLRALTERTNLVYYDWELTNRRIDAWFHIGQLFRFLLAQSHLPPKSASTAFLAAVQPKAGLSITTVVQTGPAQLSFGRNSRTGLTAFELHLLADWLESPCFPAGLNTFTGPPGPPAKSRTPVMPKARGTNNAAMGSVPRQAQK